MTNTESCCQVLLALLAFSSLSTEVAGANILFFIGGTSSHSHRYGIEPLAIRLAEKGHNITFFSPLKPSKPNDKVRNFIVPELQVVHNDFAAKFGILGLQERIKTKYNMDVMNDLDEIFNIGLSMAEVMLKSEAFHRWVNSSQFELVVVDKTTLSEIAYALAYKFQAKLISYTGTAIIMPWDVDLFGIPAESSWIPTLDVNFMTKDMDFLARLKTEISWFRWRRAHSSYLERHTKMLRQGLNMAEMPSLEKLIKNESIVFSNFHYSDGYARSVPPFHVAAGGMHLEESNGTLPKDLEDFIAKGGDAGFIYISFGSIVTISTMPEWLLQVFFTSIRASKMRFLWKWEGEKPKNLPENVFLQKWFPQNDVLAHPKIRGFITQGGQVSIQQTIYHGVPVMIFPVNGDQDFNAKRVRRFGNGIEMEFADLTSEHLSASLKELVENPTYREAANKLKIASRERPLSAIDEAVWWTEFVLRHDADVMRLLKPLSMAQPWWVVRMLDVWAFILFSALAVAIVSLLLSWKILKVVINIVSTNLEGGNDKTKKFR